MYRGTTPTHTFNVNTDLRTASAIYITYEQNEKPVVEKTGTAITVNQTTLVTTLTQEETLKFRDERVYIQIRARFPDGSAIASNIITASVDKILKEGEI